MIRLEKTRFGTISLDETTQIRFPRGLIGFSSETSFALLERERGPIAYLQSLSTPGIALPVIDARFLQPTYPETASEDLAGLAGVAPDDLLVLVVLAIEPDDGTLRANLLAPLVVDAKNRTGAQILLDPDRYGPSVQIAEATVKRTSPPSSGTRLVASTAPVAELATTG